MVFTSKKKAFHNIIHKSQSANNRYFLLKGKGGMFCSVVSYMNSYKKVCFVLFLFKNKSAIQVQIHVFYTSKTIYESP